MHKHFMMSEDEYKKLLQKGVDDKFLFSCIKDFGEAGGKLGLMYYVDRHGDFTERPKINNDRLKKMDMVANAILNSIPTRCKIEVGDYIFFIENAQV